MRRRPCWLNSLFLYKRATFGADHHHTGAAFSSELANVIFSSPLDMCSKRSGQSPFFIMCLPESLENSREYMIIGFPASRNKVNPVAHEVAATAYGYRNRSIKDSAHSGHGLTPEAHLVLPLNLEIGFDSNGKRRNFPKPQGMSGSPVLSLVRRELARRLASIPCCRSWDKILEERTPSCWNGHRRGAGYDQ